MAAKTVVIHVYPVVSPVPPLGKIMFSKFPRGAAWSSSQLSACRCGLWEPVSAPAVGERVRFRSCPGSVYKSVPKAHARCTFDLPPNTLFSGLHPDPLQISPVLEPKRETQSDDNGEFHLAPTMGQTWAGAKVQHSPSRKAFHTSLTKIRESKRLSN